jgi:hypothetical protein
MKMRFVESKSSSSLKRIVVTLLNHAQPTSLIPKPVRGPPLEKCLNEMTASENNARTNSSIPPRGKSGKHGPPSRTLHSPYLKVYLTVSVLQSKNRHQKEDCWQTRQEDT